MVRPTGKVVGEVFEMVSDLAYFSRPVLFTDRADLQFSGDILSRILSYVFAIGVVVMLPLLCYFFRYLLPEKELRLEVHFLVSLFVCIIGLLTTVNGNVTYQAVKEPTNWKALAFAFGLFLIFFLLGMGWNKLKWVLLQKRSTHQTTSRK